MEEEKAIGFHMNSLGEWQEQFSRTTHVYIRYVDQIGEKGPFFSVPEPCRAWVSEHISEDNLDEIVKRVNESELESQVVEETDIPGVKIGAVTMKERGMTLGSWLVLAFIENEYEGELPILTVNEIDLYGAMDFLRGTGELLLNAKRSENDAVAESRRNRYSKEEMKETVERLEAMTEIIQFLESEESLEQIIQKILSSVGEYTSCGFAEVYKLQRKNDQMDLLASWYREGEQPTFEEERDIPRNLLMKYERPLVINSGSTLKLDERKALEEIHTEAIVVMPIVINRQIGMYICFGERKKERVWNVEEIRFFNDTVKIVQSIVTKRIQKNSLASSFKSLEAILDNVGSAIYVRDASTKELLFINRSLKKNFMLEIKDDSLYDVFEGNMMPDSRNGFYEVFQHDRNRWYDLHYTHLTWVDGRDVILCAIYDITEKKIYQKKIEQQAYTDFLTGLYNRMCCERDLARVVDQAKRDQTKGAMLYLDLDDFKHINDGLGHQYGDVLLKAISHSLQRINGIETTCYRMGGDEFIIIIPPEFYHQYDFIVEKIKSIFAKPWFLKDADYYCTMSMGIVEFPADSDGVHELVKKADIAMYEAKKSGKNRVIKYSESLGSSSNRRLDMEKNMRDATTSGYDEFEVYYQPVVDIQKPGFPCCGAEALIRWNSAELGFIPPSEFIPLAEYLGLINPIGNFVLREACQTCHFWNENGYPEYKVNVNLSVIQLLQPDIVEIITQTIQETGINPRNLTLEVTESLAINDMSRMKEILQRIRKLGARIALDDFGTGYSSLNHIREIPLDVIKVDQNFVKELAEDSYSQSFIRMIGELAEALNVSICVEGIETEQQFKVIEQMNVRLIQGYYFGRPMKRRDFEEQFCPKLHLQDRSGKVLPHSGIM